MGAQGTTTVNFGTSLTGSLEASAVVTGQATILTGSLAEAYIYPAPTAEHSTDEHIVDPPRVMCGPVTTGVGFTIYAYAPENPGGGQQYSDAILHYGTWTVAWVWN